MFPETNCSGKKKALTGKVVMGTDGMVSSVLNFLTFTGPRMSELKQNRI
jgi:hypothetical protein